MNFFLGLIKSKLFLTSLTIGAIALAGVYLYSLLVPQKISVTPGEPFQEPTSQKIELGNDIVVNNIYKNDAYTYESGTTVVTKNNDFQISYSPNDSSFTIAILSDNFEGARKLAENYFLTKLGIDQTAACKLNVVIHTPPQLNPEESEYEYRLSFCK